MNKQKDINYVSSNRSILGFCVVFIYIFSVYMANLPILPSKINTFSLYAMIGFTLLKMISELERFNIRSYTYWYFSLILFALMTHFYSTDPSVVIESVYNLATIIAITFVINYYINENEDFRIIICFFAFSGVVLSIFMIKMGLLNYDFRQENAVLGNANAFALILTISLMCLIWLIFYGNIRLILLYVGGSSLMLYLLLLTGARKYIIISLIFVYIIIFQKYYENYKKQLIFGTFLFLLAITSLFYIIFEYKPIYDIIGFRFEGLINAITGHGKIDLSTLRRERMIEFGWSVFKEKPLLGYGLDNFKVLYYISGGSYNYAHNNYIELLVDFGILGFSLYYGYILYLLYQLKKIKRDSLGIRDFLIATLIVFLVNDYGAVTYNLIQIQLFYAFASSYVWIKKRQGTIEYRP